MTGSHLTGAVLIACFLLPPASMTLEAAAAQDASSAHADSAATAVASSPADASRVAPLNIQVSPVLAGSSRRFWRRLLRSPISASGSAPRLYVHVRVMPVMAVSTTTRGTARTTMRRFSSRALLASVTIPVPLTTNEYAEFFGHEFEHIIEQIDRVDLEALTRARAGASRLPDGCTKRRERARWA